MENNRRMDMNKNRLETAEHLTKLGFHFENGVIESAGIHEMNGVATVSVVIRLASGGHCSLGGYSCGQFIPGNKTIKGSRFGFESLLWLMAIAGVDKSGDLGGQYVRVAMDSNDRASTIGHIFEDRWFSFMALKKELEEA